MSAPAPHPAGLVVGAPIGRGSTSTVYRAEVPASGRQVALKVLHPVTSRAGDLAARFRREFDIARELAHPHVIAVYDRGTVPAADDAGVQLWMTMELLEGGSAAALVPRPDRQPDVRGVVEVLAQVAAALDHAHALDVVHRDVKPANVLLRAGSSISAVLTDFGTAALVDDVRPLAPHGRVSGTLPYAAPELLQGLRLSPATDLYALACTAVELLTGEPPYPRSTAFAITHAHLTARPPRLEVRRGWLPTGLDDVVGRALEKDPTGRPGSCTEFVTAVADALAGVHPPPNGELRSRLVRRRGRR